MFVCHKCNVGHVGRGVYSCRYIAIGIQLYARDWRGGSPSHTAHSFSKNPVNFLRGARGKFSAEDFLAKNLFYFIANHG